MSRKLACPELASGSEARHVAELGDGLRDRGRGQARIDNALDQVERMRKEDGIVSRSLILQGEGGVEYAQIPVLVGRQCRKAFERVGVQEGRVIASSWRERRWRQSFSA